MKKYFYLLGAISTALFSSSCKKDYTCECVGSFSNSSVTYTDIFSIRDTETNAIVECEAESDEPTVYNTYSYFYDCKLK